MTSLVTDAGEEPSLTFPPNLTSTFASLKQLEERFRCRICYDLYRDPVMTSCGHHFCSVCVRKYFIYNQKCPQCEKQNHETDLRTDRDLKDILHLLCEVVLPDLEKTKVKPCSKVKSPEPEKRPEIPPKSSLPPMTQPAPKPSTARMVTSPKPSTSSSRMVTSPQPLTSRSTLTLTSPEPSTSKASDSKLDDPRCPVCNVPIPDARMNKHLDLCLSGLPDPDLEKVTLPPISEPKVISKPPPPASPVHKTLSLTQTISPNLLRKHKMRPVQKVVYHLLKDSELKKRLRDEGLDVKGDRKALIARHQRFSVIWNSQCDLDNPLSRMAIVMKVRKEEQALKNESKQFKTNALLKYDKNTEPEVRDKMKEDYAKENKGHFNDLIAQVKKNEAERRLRKEEEKKGEETKVNEEVTEGEDFDPLNESVAGPPSPAFKGFQSPPFFKQGQRSISPPKANQSSMSVSNDGDLSVVKSQGQANLSQVVSTASSEDLFNDFEELSPSLIPEDEGKLKGQMESVLVHEEPKVKEASSSKGVGQLYVTPKRKSSKELTECLSPKRLKQNGILEAIQSQAARTKSASKLSSKKSPCPVCSQNVAASFMNVHLDRCLRKSEAEVKQPRSSKVTRGRKKVTKDDDEEEEAEESGASEDEDDFGEFSSQSQSARFSDLKPRTQTERRSKVKASETLLEETKVEESDLESGDLDLEPPSSKGDLKNKENVSTENVSKEQKTEVTSRAKRSKRLASKRSNKD